MKNTVTVLIVLVCLTLPKTQAVSPPPDGGYPGGNTAEGQNALFSRTTGGFNTGVGWFSLKSLTTGSFNTGVGAGTLVLNTADQNTATGAGALLSNTTGTQNTANGAFALFATPLGTIIMLGFKRLSNTANNGFEALSGNTTGDRNTANRCSTRSVATRTGGLNNTADRVGGALVRQHSPVQQHGHGTRSSNTAGAQHGHRY